MFLYPESVYPIFRDMAYFSINLQTSQYLEPAQQLLDEVVCLSNAVEPGLDEEIRKIRSIGVRLPSSGRYLQLGYGMKQHEGDTHQPSEKHIVQIKIDKLEALLHELERRCEQYFNELDRVVSSFEVIAGTGAAAPYTALTIQAMSKHFSNLRDAIIAQIHSSTMTLSKEFPTGPSRFCEHRTLDEGPVHWDSPRSFSCSNMRGRATEREHRGTAIALLRAWLFEHMLHPYPDANEKIMLASKTGLTILQVSNWFINARCRLWKPLIEELYREELEDDSGARSS